MKKTIIIRSQSQRDYLRSLIPQIPEGFAVEIKEAKRTVEQNAAQWPILDAFSKQLQWPINGEMVYMDAEDWKHVLTAVFYAENVRVAKAWRGGGVVMLPQRTSKFGKRNFSDWLEFLHSEAAEIGVIVYTDGGDK